MNCRFCNTELKNVFVSLGSTPLSNSYLKEDSLTQQEASYPLQVYVCDQCFLVQLDQFESPDDIFSDYAYFSSCSQSWLNHSKKYVEKMIKEYGINKDSFVMEIASNDGYLLQYFVENKIPVLGIEPAKNVAEKAREKGVPTESVFLGAATAKKLVAENACADLVLGNNVLAHVPDLNDFVEGLKILLASDGIITMEFPHLMRLIQGNQFDTIYHEHFSYFSFLTVEKVFKAHGLKIFNIDELPTHGGSLRIYACHSSNKDRCVLENVDQLRQREIEAGYADINHYLGFEKNVLAVKDSLTTFLTQAKKENKTIAAYGAAAKGNTLLNYCGVTSDSIQYVVDRNQHKQGLFLPGSRIPIKHPDMIKQTKPDYLIILPWNIKDEIMEQNKYIRDWNGQFIVPIPELEIV